MSETKAGRPRPLGLADVLRALREDLVEAMRAAGDGGGITFPIESAELVVHVGVTRQAEARGGIDVWVVEFGSGGTYSRDEIQTITLKLGAPVDAYGAPVQVARKLAEKP